MNCNIQNYQQRIEQMIFDSDSDENQDLSDSGLLVSKINLKILNKCQMILRVIMRSRNNLQSVNTRSSTNINNVLMEQMTPIGINEKKTP